MTTEATRQHDPHCSFGLSPWLALWGAVGVLRALLDFASYWVDWSVAGQALAWAAAAATASGALAQALRHPARFKVFGRRILPPMLTVLGSVALLDYVHAIDARFSPLLRALVLAVAFVYAGAAGQRGLLAIGLWLFAAAVVLAVRYLGYAPLALEGLSGLALLAAAYLLRQGGRRLAKLRRRA